MAKFSSSAPLNEMPMEDARKRGRLKRHAARAPPDDWNLSRPRQFRPRRRTVVPHGKAPGARARPPSLHRNDRLDRRVRIVTLDGDVLVAEVEHRAYRRIELQPRQRPRFATQLQARLLDMVVVQVRITQGMHEIAHAQAADLRHHVGEQRIAGDVERHAEKNVAGALVQLAAELAVRHVELEQGMAGQQRHLRQLAHVPGADDQPARIGVAPNLLDHPADLVDRATVDGGPGAPLPPVDRTELAMFIGPFVPDAHAVLFQVGDVGVAAQEPDQLVHDRLQVQLLGGDQRKTLRKIETHLPAEHAARAGAGAVRLFGAMSEDVLKQIEIGTHQARITAAGIVRERATRVVWSHGPAWARRAPSRSAPGRSRSAAATAAGPWLPTRCPTGNQAADRARARTPPRSGTRHTAARTGPTPGSAVAVSATPATAPRTSPALPDRARRAATDGAAGRRTDAAAPASRDAPWPRPRPRRGRSGRSSPTARARACPTARRC